MPNRLAVINVLTQDVLGAQQWNGLRGECVTMPTDDYDAVKDAMAAILERAVRAVNWNRLLREAAGRHLQLHPDHEPDARDWNAATGVCGDCLAEALLTDDMGAPNWDEHPTSPRAHESRDWPAVVAEHFHHRQAAHWHPFKDQPTAQTPPPPRARPARRRQPLTPDR